MKCLLHFDPGPRLRGVIARRLAPSPLVVVPEDDEEALYREIGDTSILLHVLAPVDAALMRRAPQLRLVQKVGVGVDSIDLEAARQRGIAVCNMPGTNSQAVAELTLLLMLATLRRVNELDRATRNGSGWPLPRELVDGLGELAGRTVGLVGFGAVPQRLAPILHAMGARPVTWSRSEPDDGITAASFDTLLRESDIVSLHLPATPETTGLMDATALARMRPGAILINTARGSLCDGDALVGALRSGHLAGAGLDVFAREPLEATDPLLELPNVVVTPHVAWLTEETIHRSMDVMTENLRRLATGAELVNRIV